MTPFLQFNPDESVLKANKSAEKAYNAAMVENCQHSID